INGRECQSFSPVSDTYFRYQNLSRGPGPRVRYPLESRLRWFFQSRCSSAMRIRFIFYLFTGALILVSARLFYWQVIDGGSLAHAAELQRSAVRSIPAARGDILASDGKELVGNEP